MKRFNPFRIGTDCDVPRVGAAAPTLGYMMTILSGLAVARRASATEDTVARSATATN
jgi:hypothetical protein